MSNRTGFQCERCGTCNVTVFEGFEFTTIECHECGHQENIYKYDEEYDQDALEDLFGWEKDIQ